MVYERTDCLDMDEITEKAKILGEAIRDSEEMKEYLKKEIEYQSDSEAQKVTAEYNELRESLALKAKDEKITPAEMLDIRKQLGAKYEEVSRFPVISEYLAAKKKVEDILAKTNSIIRYYVTGETDEAESGCGGNCSSCGGCH